MKTLQKILTIFIVVSAVSGALMMWIDLWHYSHALDSAGMVGIGFNTMSNNY